MAEEQVEKLIRLKYKMQYSHCPRRQNPALFGKCHINCQIQSVMLIISSQNMKMRRLMSYDPAFGPQILIKNTTFFFFFIQL